MFRKYPSLLKYNFKCVCQRHFAESPASQVGLKKDLNKYLGRAYDPISVEEGWYDWWQSQGHFSAQSRRGSSEEFTVLLPPPNVTGTLHLGHALTCSIQDVLARWHRMQGLSVCWVPGMDHAGIATQAVIEKHLASSNQSGMTRSKCLEEAYKWTKDKRGVIRNQMRQLGASLDWEKEFFTLDEHQHTAVKEAFVRLNSQGLVYRAEALVSWSCALRSAIADIEVDWKELNGATSLRVPGHETPVTFGVLTNVALPLADQAGKEIVVATTRVETMLGDVAVAVHPEDSRYSNLIGQHVTHPFRPGVQIPIIADNVVDPLFGTGAVKITPAHDTTDFEIGKRHSLSCLTVFAEDGTIAPECTLFAGLSRFNARSAMTERLGQMGLLRGETVLASSKVPLCSRSGDIVELMLKPQWFINCREMAKQAMDAVTAGELIIEPPAFNKVWFDWLLNIRDWCVSRQLWWGHRIPAYFCTAEGLNEGVWVAARDEQEARIQGANMLGTTKVTIAQDPDVLDTWFSSSLLPLSVFGWPEQQSIKSLSLMETGHDIIFFWVARMVMLGTQLSGQLPFKKILLHGIICDAHGRKMSKSLGNVIHPEDIINGTQLQVLLDRTQKAHKLSGGSETELKKALSAQRSSFPNGIPTCGTDALRFTLCSHNVKNHFVNFDVSECHTNRLFCNKIWQVTRFVLTAIQEKTPSLNLESSKEGLMDKWIQSRLAEAVQTVNTALQNTNFHEATAAIKEFVYGEFCDVYVECSKAPLRDASTAAITSNTLATCLQTSLHLLAPFMPYLSEELYQKLPSNLRMSTSVHLSPFPSSQQWSMRRNKEIEAEVKILLNVVQIIRRLKNTANVKKQEAKVCLEVNCNSIEFKLLTREIKVMQTLGGCSELEVCTQVSSPCISEILSTSCTVHLLGQHKLKKKSEKKESKLQKELEKLLSITKSQGFREKASEEVKIAHREKIEKLKAELAKNIQDLP